MQFQRSNTGWRRRRPRFLCGACVALIACLVGCQNGLTPNGGLPIFGKSAKKADVERQAAKDPFPTPSDVGLK